MMEEADSSYKGGPCSSVWKPPGKQAKQYSNLASVAEIRFRRWRSVGRGGTEVREMLRFQETFHAATNDP
jgi:hypothetical protein